MLHIVVSPELLAFVPHYRGCAITAHVKNSPTSAQLWAEVERLSADLREHYDTSTIKERAGIRETRAAYRAIGKDPSRYRPSCEQLCRRVLQGKDLYSIDTLVDLGNAVSIWSGYSTAVVDTNKLSGNTVTLGIGREGEPYEAIGRGVLNIHRLPVFRDSIGAFATPTSDSVRTECESSTSEVLIIINAYDGSKPRLQAATDYTLELLSRFTHAKNTIIIPF